MDEAQRGELEGDLRRRLEHDDFEGAATQAVRGYGPEIFAFLLAIHRDEDDASEVFSRFAEGLWRGLKGFAGQCSVRTFAYAIARKASLQHRRDKGRRAVRFARLGEGSTVADVAEQVRTRTLPYLRTETRSRLAELRDALSPEDQELLMLRVDRQLAWNELVQVLRGEDEEPLSPEAQKREAARLRKRFQLLKDQLREAARREGLLDPDAGG
ncbi:MAG TPA: sigma-70 family RNA polymerase sigma factor [Polyangiaceae bacterium]|jgi:RNA polymerase sigma-70 factor (ECF subfamily)|nr:sigma-70 family RNA polymerase sigma factor [Polyangiaceae bacterium]